MEVGGYRAERQTVGFAQVKRQERFSAWYHPSDFLSPLFRSKTCLLLPHPSCRVQKQQPMRQPKFYWNTFRAEFP